MKKKIVFTLLLLVTILFISTNFIEKLQYQLLNEQGKELFDLVKEREKISKNYDENISENIIKIPLIDIHNPVLSNGEKLKVSFDGNIGIDEKVNVKVKFDIGCFTTTLNNCEEFKIHAVSEENEVVYLIFSSREQGSNKYNATICSYDVNKSQAFGCFSYIGNSIYYDNRDNIIFSSNGLKADERRNGTLVELKYHYNISNMLSKEIHNQKILNKLDGFEN